VKLPPMALTAPSLCPRCDAPAIMTDHCIQCALPLGQCGSCQGTAGPFDHFCGFCGYELVQGAKRAPLWRLWLLAALIPLAAGIAFGVSPWAQPVTHRVATLVGSPPEPTPAPGTVTPLKSDSLAFSCVFPKDWTATDFSRPTDLAKQMPYVVVAHFPPDAAKVADTKGDLIQAKGQSAVVEMGRPVVNAPGVSPSDPQAVLATEVTPLLGTPPAGLKFEVVQAVRPLTVNGRPAADVILRLTRDTGVFYLERVYISSPTVGQPPLFKVEAVVPGPDWDKGDQQRVEDMVHSIKFTS
jgi:hypothetical protein